MRRFALVLALALPLFAQLPDGVERRRYGFDGSTPVHLIATSDGVLWAGSIHTDALHRFDPSGDVTPFYRLDAEEISDMDLGPDGALWLATNRHVARYDRDTNVVHTWPELRFASHILSGPDGNIWVVRPGAESRLVRLTTSGVVASTMTLEGDVAGAVAGSDGAVWLSISHAGSSKLVRVTADGNRSESPLESASPLFAGPGFLWTSFPDRIVRLNLQGVVVGTYRVAMSPAGVDAAGNLWLRARTGTLEEIARLTPGGVLTRFAPLPALSPVVCYEGGPTNIYEAVHGGFAPLPDGRVAMMDFYDYSTSRMPICAAMDGGRIEYALTILDPALAPVVSTEQLSPAPRRRLVRR